MEYLIGILIALAVCIFALLTGFDRERAFYSTVVIVVAHYYILFAVMGATASVLISECVAAAVFIILAVIGFKTNLWTSLRPSPDTASSTSSTTSSFRIPESPSGGPASACPSTSSLAVSSQCSYYAVLTPSLPGRLQG